MLQDHDGDYLNLSKYERHRTQISEGKQRAALIKNIQEKYLNPVLSVMEGEQLQRMHSRAERDFYKLKLKTQKQQPNAPDVVETSPLSHSDVPSPKSNQLSPNSIGQYLTEIFSPENNNTNDNKGRLRTNSFKGAAGNDLHIIDIHTPTRRRDGDDYESDRMTPDLTIVKQHSANTIQK